MIHNINIEQFLEKTQELPVIDVRSPIEYDKGHIPGAFNIPLFTNEERVEIGTLYKKEGREPATLRALRYLGPKIESFVRKVRKIAPNKKVLLHCWRGGMRSESFAWLLKTCDFEVFLLNNGYKAYRNYLLSEFEKDIELFVLGGMTGSGKTEILKYIKKEGLQVIDLEGIACHKGSAFGSLGQKSQPTSEQFQNNLFVEWQKLDFSKPLWLEDESLSIGAVNLPEAIFRKVRNSNVIFIEIPIDIRAIRLVNEYACFDLPILNEKVNRITKRLGSQNVKLAIEAYEQKNYKKAAEIVLVYYDKAYRRGLNNRDQKLVHHLPINEDNPEKSAVIIQKFVENISSKNNQ